MKKILLILIIISSITNAQNKSVEKSIFNIQVGTVGIWVNNESMLFDEIALRTEIGLYTEIVKEKGFFMSPEITLEPRWYYNLKKRVSNKLDISNNSANFFTIKTSFRSNIFEISNYEDKRAEKSISFIPKWGLRRSLGANFNYELGLGIGYLSYINQKYFTVSDSDGIVIDLHLRIGFKF